MCYKTKVIRENRDNVILSGDKDSSIVIMNKKYYNRKIDDMINERIQQGKYKETDYNILKELESFQSFLYRYFKNSSHSREMLPSSYQPSRFFCYSKNSQIRKY